MFYTKQVKVFLIKLLVFLTLCPDKHDSLIITSVLAGDKKFKTISFDSKFLKPLTFEKDMPSTEFRRHRTLRPPKFDIDVNIPIKLPLEDEYPQEEYKKPVESNIYFQSDEISEPGYEKGNYKKKTYDEYASSSENRKVVAPPQTSSIVEQGFKLLPILAKSIKIRPTFETGQEPQSNARSDTKEVLRGQQQVMMAQESSYGPQNYAQHKSTYGGEYQQQEFIPGGYVNLQLSGPTGGPKMTYEDYDKEKWAQQLSQTPGAMPYPILNYHQLQNFYGGLGTFTNGLADQRYVETTLLDKIKSGLTHFTDKFHFG